jgi:hypothetical protein
MAAQLAHARWRQADAVFMVFDLFRQADLHEVSPLSVGVSQFASAPKKLTVLLKFGYIH